MKNALGTPNLDAIKLLANNKKRAETKIIGLIVRLPTMKCLSYRFRTTNSACFAHFSIMIRSSSISKHDRDFNQNYIKFVSSSSSPSPLFSNEFSMFLLLSESHFDSLLLVTNRDVRQLFILIEKFIKINWNERARGQKRIDGEKQLQQCN